MKKMFLSLVAAIVAATATYAQSSLVATLNHENQISVFNGQYALSAALAAAEHGDIITLSSGTFVAADITKAVTLRGAGNADDNITGQTVTRVSGNFYLNIPNDVEQRLSIEGIIFTGTMYKKDPEHKYATFTKCQFATIDYAGTGPAVGWRFIDCYISSMIRLYEGTTATFLNCRVCEPCAYTSDSKPSSYEFDHCIVVSRNSAGFGNYPLRNSKFYNCFIFEIEPYFSNLTYRGLQATNEAYNCVGYDAAEVSVFRYINQNSNTDLTTDEYNALFKEDTFYELTDEAKAKYKDADGGEVGLYGGVMPYSMSIQTPQITKLNVAQKTTTDGKLNVSIEVTATDE